MRRPNAGRTDQPGALLFRAGRSRRLLDFGKRRPPLPTRSSGLIERHETAAMPLKEMSPRRLLNARDARASKRRTVSLDIETDCDVRHQWGSSRTVPWWLRASPTVVGRTSAQCARSDEVGSGLKVVASG